MMENVKNLFNQAQWSAVDHCTLPNNDEFATLLLTRSALTSALRAYTRGKIVFDLIQVGWRLPTDVLGHDPDYTGSAAMWIREVAFRLEQEPMVYAYSIFPVATFSRYEKEIKAIGEQPLGETLLPTYPIHRGELALALVKASGEEFWLRRSDFYWGESIFKVYEVLMPALQEALTPEQGKRI